MDQLYNYFIQNLSISYECSLSIGNSLILEEMLNEVIYTIVHKTNAQRGTIWLFKEKEELQIGARAGSRLTKKEIIIRKHNYNTIFQQIYLNQKPVIKFKDDKEFLQYCNFIIGREEAVLIIPINKEAILHLVYFKKEIVNETLANMLCGLSTKLSIAIKSCIEHENIITEIQKRIRLEKKYRDLFEKSEDASLVIHNGKFVDCNQAAVNMLRYNNKDELLNTHPSELSPARQPDGKMSFAKANEMMRIAFKKGSHRFEWDHEKSDREIFPVEVLLTAISIDEDNQVLHTVWRDITERKEAEQLQLVLYNIAEAVNTTKYLDEFYHTIHQLLSTIIDATNFYIALYNEEKNIIWFAYYVDEKDPKPEPVPKKLSKGLTEYVILTGKSLLAPKEYCIKLAKEGKIEMSGSIPEVWLGVPLRIGKKTIGVMALQSYKNISIYNEKDVEILELVSYQIAIAIERKQAEKEREKLYLESEESRISLLSILEDVTEKEVALCESQERFQAIVTNTGDWIWETDKEGRFTYCSPVVKQVLGYMPEEVLGMHYYDFFHPDERVELIKTALVIFNKKEKFKSLINRNMHKDGRVIFLETNAVPLLDDKEILLGYRGVNRDITERKKSENIQRALYNISNAVNITDNLQELLIKIREYLGNVIDTTNFYVALYDENTDMISLPFVIDEKNTYETFPAGKTLTYYVIQLRKPLFATRQLQEELTDQGKIEILGTYSEIWLGVPLKTENKVMGVISVQSFDNPHLYTEKDMEILTFVSEEITLAIRHKQAEEQIKKDLEEKNILLKELYHRTKNNMQVISSMLNMKSRQSDNEFIHATFKEITHKIKAMSLVHQKLYQSQDLSRINLKEYIENFSGLLMKSYGIQSEKISLKLELDNVLVLIDSAIPCGLVLNELISNVIEAAHEKRPI